MMRGKKGSSRSPTKRGTADHSQSKISQGSSGSNSKKGGAQKGGTHLSMYRQIMYEDVIKANPKKGQRPISKRSKKKRELNTFFPYALD